jgi:hypothetical protein
MSLLPILAAVAVLLGGALAAVAFVALRARRDAAGARAEAERLRDRFRGVVDADAERTRVLAELDAERTRVREEIAHAERAAEAGRAGAAADADRLRQEAASLEGQVAALRTEFERLDEEANLQSFGFYKPRYDFVNAIAYEARLEQIRERQKQMLKAKTAAVGDVEWHVNGSKVEGRKQINQTLKLMLRAFNGESDAAVAKVRYNNVHVMEARIRKACETVNSLAQVQQCRITREYLDLKLEELFLAHEYQEKLYEEKEEQRRIREQMREEEQAQRELERARLDAEKEEQRYEAALARARADAEKAVGAKQEKLQQQIADLELRLAEAHARKERAIAQAQLTRSGHVYVISNVGSFGEEVFKIGMTRRLDPMERIKELGDASVPFEFDVHAVIYSEDAPGLENKLHRLFHWRRVNRVNERKEFFRVGIDEIAAAVREENAEIKVVRDAEAEEFRKTLALLADETARGGPAPDALPRGGARYDRRSDRRGGVPSPASANGPARAQSGVA